MCKCQEKFLDRRNVTLRYIVLVTIYLSNTRELYGTAWSRQEHELGDTIAAIVSTIAQGLP